MKKRLFAASLAVLLLLAGCAQNAPTPSGSDSPAPSQSAEPTPTPAPSPSEEPEPSPSSTSDEVIEPSEKLAALAVENLDLQADAGIGLPIVYESDRYLIFWGVFGIFGYDLEEEKIIFSVDFKKLYGEDAYPSVQGSIMTAVEATADGTKLAVEYGDPNQPDIGSEICYIDLVNGTWTFSAEIPDRDVYFYYAPDDWKGTLIPCGPVENTIYIRDGKEWMIFQSDKTS